MSRALRRAGGESALLMIDIAAILDDLGADHLVIGAMAAAFHGVIRATTDADLLLGVRASHLDALSKRLRASGYQTELRRGDADDPIAAMLVVTDAANNRVELLSGIQGMDPLAFARAKHLDFHGRSLRFVSAEDFVAMKCHAGGPIDLEDARQIVWVVGSAFDHDLARRLARRFGRSAADALERLRD